MHVFRCDTKRTKPKTANNFNQIEHEDEPFAD